MAKYRFVVEVDDSYGSTEIKAATYLSETLGRGIGNGRGSGSYWAARIRPYKRPRAGAGAISRLEQARDQVASLEGQFDDMKHEIRPPARHGFAQCRTLVQRLITGIIGEVETERAERK